MSTYLGDFEVGKTVYIHFTTHAADDSLVNPSAAFTASDFRIYKNDSDTQRTSTAGITVASPFDSVVGRHLIAIDTSNNAHAGFYAAGNDYRVEVDSAKTIDGVDQSGVVVGTFSIQNRYAPAALDAAGIRAALGLSAANLDSQLTGISSKTTNLPASPAAVGSEMTLADGAITAAKIAANAIGATQLATNAIGASQIAGNAITSAKIAANAIGASQLAAGAIEAAKIADGALNGKGDWNVGKTGYSLADGSIVANTIAAGALNDKGNWNVGKTGYSLTEPFPSDYATAAQLTAAQEDLEDLLAAIDAKTTNLPATPAAAGDAMTLADGAITSAKIAAGAIGSTQLASGAITSAKIASNAIGASQIASNAITAAKIATSALNGKGDWNIGKTGYSLAEPFPSDYAKPSDVAQAASDVIAALPVAPDNDTIETIWEKLDLLEVDGSGRVTTANPAIEGGDVIVEPTVLDADSIAAVAAAVKLQLSALEDDAAAAKVAAELAVTRLPTTLVSGQMAAHVSGLDDALAILTDQILIIAQNVHT